MFQCAPTASVVPGDRLEQRSRRLATMAPPLEVAVQPYISNSYANLSADAGTLYDCDATGGAGRVRLVVAGVQVWVSD